MNIGFCGGSSLCEVGTISDVKLFFECLEFFVVKSDADKHWPLLTDRLYRRYLRIEELDEAGSLMKEAKNKFTTLASSEVNWKMELVGDRRRTWLDPSQPNLADVFATCFQHFDYCVESAKLFAKSWDIYQPVKIVRTELAWFMVEKNRSLEEYDLLEGEPFWAL
ncbi:hypothetical protein [Xylophilus ampelinus]|uniref:hypothetical protein n=1 Tax=Xylophilus ampelinus TaxID=54067 RepID=UPI001F2DE3CD|nr:hypothetical protein [Xylophilus ampelinus]MCS4511929.1 hypothetical protein [Xylophilus ampelinus]